MRGPNCNGNRETTVFCHLNEPWAGKGLGLKASDLAGFFGCSNCHADYDQGRLGEDKYYLLLRACITTLRRLEAKGVIKVK